MKKMKFWSMLMLVAMALPMMMACGGSDKDDDDDGGGGTSKGLVGWYAPRSDLNGGVTDWLDMVYGWEKESAEMYGNPVPALDFNYRGEVTIGGEVFYDNASEHVVYNIVNDNTIIKYDGRYFQYGASAASDMTFLFGFYHKTLGSMALYGERARYYSCWEEDGKLYSTEPEIFTITSEGIIPDGSSTVYVKYNPDKTH